MGDINNSVKMTSLTKMTTKYKRAILGENTMVVSFDGLGISSHSIFTWGHPEDRWNCESST